MVERERIQRMWKKKSRAEAHSLEKPKVLRGLIDVEDGSVAVDLPNLGVWLVFQLSNFFVRAFFGLAIYCNNAQGLRISNTRNRQTCWISQI